jgi:hypothetical protein
VHASAEDMAQHVTDAVRPVLQSLADGLAGTRAA